MDRHIQCSSLMFNRSLLWIAFCFLGLPWIAIAKEPGSPGGPYPVGPGIAAPVILTQPLPAYTDEARAARIEGPVLLQAVVRKDGTVDSFKVIRSLGYGLDESAINTIATRWHFKPGTLNGKPVDVQINIEVSFRLYGRPEDGEKLKAYPLRAVIVDATWNKDSAGNTGGSGYGNLSSSGRTRGFTYTTSCNPGFQRSAILRAKWLEPETRLEMLMTLEPAKTCECTVTMQNTIFTVKDGRVVAADPLDSIHR